MRRLVWISFALAALVTMVLLFSPGHAQSRPIVSSGGILNAASYTLDGMPNSGIARGGMFLVYGYGLGPSTLQKAPDPPTPLPTKLGETSIQVLVAGITVDALIQYTSANVVAAILPSNTPEDSGVLTLTYNGLPSTTVAIRVVHTALGVFAQNQAGSGPAVVQNYNSETDQPVNTIIEAAQPNQVMILWASGLGPASGDPAVAATPGNLDVDTQVLVGGKNAKMLYWGRSPRYPGVDQINFQLPADVPEGCYVPLSVRAGGVLSNFTSIAVSSRDKVCSDPHGLPVSTLAQLRAGQDLCLGWVQLYRLNMKLDSLVPFGSIDGSADLGFGDFFRWTPQTAVQSQSMNSGVEVPVGTCAVYPMLQNLKSFVIGSWRPNRLNVGSSLTLTGPAGIKTLPLRLNSGSYDRQPLGIWEPNISMIPASARVSYLVPGAYSLSNGTGTADFKPFQASLNIVPSSLSWSVSGGLGAIDTSQGMTVTWTGGDASREHVLIAGATFLPDLMNLQVGAVFSCAERVEAGRFTVPPAIFSALPRGTGTSLVGIGTAPLLTGQQLSIAGLDAAYFTNVQIDVRQTRFQ